MPPEPERLTQIRELIHRYFNLEEFRTLCADLGIGYDDLGGEGLQARIRELAALCDRTGRVEHLLALCVHHRPHAHWPESKVAPNQPVAFSPLTPPIQNPRQIFVSHAHQDAEFAHRLADDLRRQGWDIWMAPQSIRPGERWVTAINRGLAESAIFLLVLTPAAVQSQWVQQETDAAIDLAHHGGIRFIPLDVKTTHKPPLWQTYQWIPFQEAYQTGLEQLARALRGGLVEALIPPIPKAGETRVWDKDGKVMVYVPMGKFLYGEKKREIYLDGFWIDKTPVTNAEYKRFLDANPSHNVPYSWLLDRNYNWNKTWRICPVGKENHPVVLVSWEDAQAYAQWAGKRLPTEHEWEKAVRGTDGWEYPWGAWQSGRANTTEVGIGGTSPVGLFSPMGDSPYGCVDMAGNVSEWVDNSYENDRFPVLRGGSWHEDKTSSRCTLRGRPVPWSKNSGYWGFRCCVAPSSLSSGSGS